MLLGTGRVQILFKELKREREAEAARKDRSRKTSMGNARMFFFDFGFGWLSISKSQEKERDKTGGLGGHWVPPSNLSSPEGPTRSGGINHWSGWSAARDDDVSWLPWFQQSVFLGKLDGPKIGSPFVFARFCRTAHGLFCFHDS